MKKIKVTDDVCSNYVLVLTTTTMLELNVNEFSNNYDLRKTINIDQNDICLNKGYGNAFGN